MSYEYSIARIKDSSGNIHGAGFLVAPGRVLTCAHVVAQALNIDERTRQRPSTPVHLDFMMLHDYQTTARVVTWHPVDAVPPEEDIAVLELSQDAPLEAQAAIFRDEEDLFKHNLRICGFPLGRDNGVFAVAEARGVVRTRWLQIGVTQVHGYSIEKGFSGAPVFDHELNGVIGMVVARDTNPLTREAYIIPTSVIQGVLEARARPRIFLAPPKLEIELVGREVRLQEVKGNLFNGPAAGRLVLHGLPGMGKTSFATALVHDAQVQDHFRDGILWADVGRKPELAALLGDWCRALGLTAGELAALDTLEERRRKLRALMENKKLLLVVDDVWEMQHAEAFFLGGPECKHLVVTRIPEIERVLRFKSKAVSVGLDELSASEGLQLFGEYAPTVVQNNPQVAQELVAAVGALPLGLTLIGTYLGTEALRNEPNRVEAALKKMLSSNEHLRVRHRAEEVSLFAAIEISVEGLDPKAQLALYKLSVFPSKPNSFTAVAARSVCLIADEELDTLVDKGLLENSSGRYVMHQTIKSYASHKLEEQGEDVVARIQRALVEYYVRFVEQQPSDFNALDEERTNIFRALSTAYELKMPIALLGGTNAIAKWIEVRGLYDVARTHMNNAEKVAESRGDREELATVLCNKGRLEEKLGNFEEANKLLHKSLLLSQGIYRHKQSELLLNMGIVAYNLARYNEANHHLKEGLKLSAELEDQHLKCLMLQRLSLIEFCRGNLDKAKRYINQGLSTAWSLERNEEVMVLLLIDQGRIELRRGQYKKAEATAREGLRIADNIGYLEANAALKQILSKVILMQNQYEQAEELIDECIAIGREISHRWYTSLFLYERGEIYLKWNADNRHQGRQAVEGDEHRACAERDFEEALQTAGEIKCPDLVAYALYGKARVAETVGNFEEARLLAGQSYEMLNAIEHYKAAKVAQFLQGLPTFET